MSNRQAEPAGGPGQLAVEACASLSLLQPNPDSGGVGEWLIPPGCKLGALTGYAGSNPAPATRYETAGIKEVTGRGTGPQPPLQTPAHVAQQVEHVLGKNGVTGSSPVVGSSIWNISQSRDIIA